MQNNIIFGYNQLLTSAAVAEHDYFNLSTFEDFNRLVEGIVLYDKVLLLGDYDLPSSYLFSELKNEKIFETVSDAEIRDLLKETETRSNYNQKLSLIFGDQALEASDTNPDELLNLRISPNPYDRNAMDWFLEQVVILDESNNLSQKTFRDQVAKKLFLSRNEGGHFYYFARSLVYSSVADKLSMDYMPDYIRMPLASMAFRLDKPKISTQLYNSMSQKFKLEVEGLSLLGMPTPMYVPPIMAAVLEKKPPPKDIPNEIIKLRHKFSNYRKKYRSFLEDLQNPNLSIKEKLENKARLVDAIESVIKKQTTNHALNIKTIWDKMVSSSLSEEELSSRISLSGAASLIIEEIHRQHVMGRAKAIFDLWTDTRSIKNYGKLLEDNFGTTITSEEIDFTSKYSHALKTIIRK